MAHQSRNGGDIPGLKAGEDLSLKQFTFVDLDANGDVVTAVAGVAALGVLENDPALGQAAGVFTGNSIAKVVAGAAIAPGDEIAVGADGKAAVAVATNYIIGRCVEGAAADGEICSVLLESIGIKA